MYGLKTLMYCPHIITKSKLSTQSMSRLWNLNLFFLFGTFVPCPISHKQIFKLPKNSKTLIFPNMQTVSMSHQK